MKTIRFQVTDEEYRRYREAVEWFHDGWIHADGSSRATVEEVAKFLLKMRCKEYQAAMEANLRKKREERERELSSIIPFHAGQDCQ